MFGRIIFWKKEFLNRNAVLKEILMGILFKTLFIKKCYSTQEYFYPNLYLWVMFWCTLSIH